MFGLAGLPCPISPSKLPIIGRLSAASFSCFYHLHVLLLLGKKCCRYLGKAHQGGLGDTTQSLFLSPKSAKPFIWGAGPVFLLPTATDHNTLGAYRWGMGPTGVILKQAGPWTFGALANHIWSFARDDGRKEVNSTYLQPFVAYTFKTATTITVNTESTYDWIEEQWTVPLFAGVSQIVKLGKLPVQFTLGGQYWVEGPDSAPDWSMRFVVTFLFPK